MRRRPFKIASILLTILCLATAVLWVRSHSCYDSWSYGKTTGGFCELSSGFGGVCVECGTSSPPLDGLWHSTEPIGPGMRATWGETNLLGFHLTVHQQRLVYVTAIAESQNSPPANVSTTAASGPPSSTSVVSSLVVPYWFLFLTTAVFAAFALRLSRRPSGSGHCPTCGYDLTGNISGVCPECGVCVPRSLPDQPGSR